MEPILVSVLVFLFMGGNMLAVKNSARSPDVDRYETVDRTVIVKDGEEWIREIKTREVKKKWNLKIQGKENRKSQEQSVSLIKIEDTTNSSQPNQYVGWRSTTSVEQENTLPETGRREESGADASARR